MSSQAPARPARGRRSWGNPDPGDGAGIDQRVLDAVRNRVSGGNRQLSGADLAGAVRASGLVVGSGSAAKVIRMLQEDLRGLGPLQRIADVPGTTDVLVDAAGLVWSDGRQGLAPTDLRFAEPEEVRRLAVRLAAAGGRRLDDAQPFADVVLGRYRIHSVLPPVSAGGPLISIRVRSAGPACLGSVLSGGSTSPWHPVMRAIVRGRLNFLVSGGTGSGKTTLLGAMLGEAAPNERLLVVEDAQELAPAHPHVVSVQCRTGNVEGAGRIGMADLVRQALRMRPDRLVVGECRGAEIREFLAAMNTGHDGAGGTIHASSASAVPARLAAMAALADMSPQSVAIQASSALDLVIHMERNGQQRAPRQLCRLRGTSRSTLEMQTVLEQDASGGLLPGPAAEWFIRTLSARSIPCPW